MTTPNANIWTPQQFMEEGRVGDLGLLDVRFMRPYVGMHKNIAAGAARIHRNTLLRKYDWEVIDQAVLDVFKDPPIGIDDLRNAGLVKPLGGLGAIISTYQQLSDMTDADVSMDVTPKKGESDRVEFTDVSVPVPIISKPFTLSLRHLEASRRSGEGLDTIQIRTATRKVREKAENILFNGSTKQLQSYKIYGYTTAPHRLTKTAAAWGGGDFGTDTNAHKTLVGMIKNLNEIGFRGPFGVYVSGNQYAELLALTGTNKSETQLSVILRTIPDLLWVKRSYELADGKLIMVQMTSDVVDLAIGQDIIPVQWTEQGGMLVEFKVMTAMVPRIKYDAEDQCGIAEATSC